MGVWIRQMRAGLDFGVGDAIAAQMANFVYLIGDNDSRQCVVVDPAWDVSGILAHVDQSGYTLVGALATHYHPDHVGGEVFGITISGLAELMGLRPVRVFVNSAEADGLRKVTGLSETELVRVSGGDSFELGAARIRFLHTPGHTPGSQCFLVDNNLVSGDTLFIGGCGRVDLPGGDPATMYHSLTQVLAKLPDDTVLYPGHDYAAVPTSTIGEEKQSNFYLRVRSLDDWQALMGNQ